jgi:branched-chain amino acid transport system ATP-binding protein
VTSALRVQDLEAGYEPGLPIVRGASLEVAEGEILAVIGPNGAGKSTLIKAVAGLVPVSRGRVSIGERDITGRPAHRLAHEGLGFVPQTENVFVNLTIRENLDLAAAVLKAPKLRLVEVYDFFPDLARQQRLLAGRLSGGQRQMLAVARALIGGPQVLMLDEPSAGLSPVLVDRVLAVVAKLQQTGTAILLVEQLIEKALAVADRVYALAQGKVVLEASTDEADLPRRLERAYFGPEAA